MKKPDSYASMLIVAVLVLFALMVGTIYKINQQNDVIAQGHYAPTKQHGFMIPPTLQHKKVSLLRLKETALFHQKSGSAVSAYTEKIKKFAAFIESIGLKTEVITSDDIASLGSEDVLFVLDAQVISQEDKQKIVHFVKQGGGLFFNFLAGFSDENAQYKGAGFVHDMTNLSLSAKGFADFKEGLSVTQKILSPFAKYIKEGQLLSVALYDKLPIYKTTPADMADIFAASYDQISPPIVKDEAMRFNNDEGAVAWHGYQGRGKWIYTSLPSYAFYDIAKQQDDYKKILAGMIDFLSQKTVVQVYPYIDQDSAVFVSEDTEYKFTNFKRFSDLAKEYQVPVTAFIVANLAVLPEHQKMVAEIATNPYVEFASHSTTHKKIVGESEAFIINETAHSKALIDPIAPTPIRGFRPPREELNKLMKKHLAKSGFSYVLGAAASYLYPRVDNEEHRLIYMPRHGTDDYSYLVNLDWDQKEISKQIEQEAQYVTGLNGIYTLSVHTHLFSYSSNIEIIRTFFKYLKKHPELKPLQGREIIKRVLLHENIEQSVIQKGNEVMITLENKNAIAVKNLHLKIFKNPKTRIVSGRVDAGLNVSLFEDSDAIMIDTLPANKKVTLYITLEG